MSWLNTINILAVVQTNSANTLAVVQQPSSGTHNANIVIIAIVAFIIILIAATLFKRKK